MIKFLGILGFFIALALQCAAQQQQPAHPHAHLRTYKIGENFTLQCKDSKGEWGPGPICVETGEPVKFRYGVDMMLHCGWKIEGDSSYSYEHFKELITQNANWNCRVAIIPDADFHLPFAIPIWGVVEEDHIHIDTHLNFVFHGDLVGRIIGVAAYSVQDYFQPAISGSTVRIHGPVKWFKGHYFQDFSSNSLFKAGTGMSALELLVRNAPVLGLVLAWCIVAALATMLGATVYYKYRLKPAIIEKYQKLD